MRIGMAWESKSAAFYRSVEPMREMERLGHEVAWPASKDGEPQLGTLMQCDVVHVYRRHDPQTQAVLKQLRARNVGIVWDTDDDLSQLPRESPLYKTTGGVHAQRIHRATVKTARHAHVVTTTTDTLERKYRAEGVETIEVISNYLAGEPKRRRRKHDGVVIGWIAGLEHNADARRLPIADSLLRILDEHADVRVECIGVDLQLPQRYRHDELVPFLELPERIGGFDIAIAPLADIPFNHARSDIKIKEYAASAVPWLASPVGPYANLGEEQGGRLVADDGWYDALDQLLRRPRDRKRLGRHGKRWASTQRVRTEARRWEQVLTKAMTLANP